MSTSRSSPGSPTVAVGVYTPGHAPTSKRSTVGYRYIHSAIDDRTRIVYSEIHTDEKAGTAVGFWHRALALSP